MQTNTKLLSLAIAGGIALSGLAPAQNQEALKEKLAKTLDSDWIKSPAWETDYDKARERAKKEDKIIFGYFTRSYAF